MKLWIGKSYLSSESDYYSLILDAKEVNILDKEGNERVSIVGKVCYFATFKGALLRLREHLINKSKASNLKILLDDIIEIDRDFSKKLNFSFSDYEIVRKEESDLLKKIKELETKLNEVIKCQKNCQEKN